MKHLLLTLLLLGTATAAHAEADFSAGRFRLELSGGAGVTDREDTGFLGAANVEYEFPLGGRHTLGLRVYPALFYQGEDDNVFGAGLGLSYKLYQHADTRTGIFGELTTAALFHDGEFPGNGSNANFLSGLGLGYEFKNSWHVTLRVEHISNAGLDSPNDGLNNFGVAFGFGF